MTPKEYLTDIRISYAKKLLREQDQSHSSIADIGVMCGYTDAKYFSRIFRSATGLAPSDFAAQYRCEISEKH
jgi:AraC-like DNA-binding protein